MCPTVLVETGSVAVETTATEPTSHEDDNPAVDEEELGRGKRVRRESVLLRNFVTNTVRKSNNDPTSSSPVPHHSSDESEHETKLDQLPEDCIVEVLSFTSPHDVCHMSLVSTMARHAAMSDSLWETFLPTDYQEILSRSVSPIVFASKKELFLKPFTPLLIDGGRKTFSIDRKTSKLCYMLSARELSITWSTNPLYWCWKPLLQSRFPEGVELIMVNWLEIKCKITTRMLSLRTTYGAYLVLNLADRAFGLDFMPSEVSVKVGTDPESKGIVYLRRNCTDNRKQELERFVMGHRVETLRSRVDDTGSGQELAVCQRDDGWLEIELGEFYCNGVDDTKVTMCLKEIKGQHLKGGLVIEGIELRPK